MSRTNSRVDAYVRGAPRWQGELRKLRSLLLDCELEEDLKWGKPCFMLDGRNVAILQPFKPHCALMFFKGALLEDTHGLLRRQGPNTRAARRLEFTGEREIVASVVRSYVEQAIAVERDGAQVDLEASGELELPGELTRALQQDRALARAFDALTPGRQRGYALHIASAKHSRTRSARVERCAPAILAGKGLHDR